MQTFITYHNMSNTASSLDYKRLGKQRVEAIQIANCLLVHENRWSNHPAVKMWKSYEPFLIKVYLHDIMEEWVQRGYKNERCYAHYENLINIIGNMKIIKPNWITDNFIETHRSNLINKDEEHYLKLWPNTIRHLPYIWPI